MDTGTRSWLAVAGSVFLHGAAVWALLAIANDGGLSQQQSESISTASVDTIVVDAVPDEVAEPPAASVAQSAVEVAEAPEKQPQPEPQLEPEPAKAYPPPPVKEETQQTSLPDPAALQKLEEPLHKPKPTLEPPKPPKRKETKRKQTPSAEKPRMASVNARGEARGGAARGQITASHGDLLSYAAQVRARVAGRKPSGIGHRGTAVVAFGVSSSGSVTHASIIRSSGSGALDHASVAAVRGAGPFPLPPDRRAHSFSIPFHFQ